MMMQSPATSLTFWIGKDKKAPPQPQQLLTFTGRSRAGDGTAFFVPELSWMFDCGALVTKQAPKVLFLTHTHSDHVLFLTRLIEKAPKPLNIYLPKRAVPLVRQHVHTFQEMVNGGVVDAVNGDDDEKEDSSPTKKQEQQSTTLFEKCTLHGLDPREEVSISKYLVKTIECTHRIPCLGYSVYRKVSRLQPEYTSLTSQQIRELRKQGVETSSEVHEPLFCYLGDTTHHVLEQHPEILAEHSTIIVECSFLDSNDRQRAEKTQHMHWDHLQPLVHSHPHTLFILTHFSLKYSNAKIRTFFRDIHNVHPMIMEEELCVEWDKGKVKQTIPEDEPVPKCQCFVCTIAAGDTR